MVDSVTPVPGNNTVIQQGGQPVLAADVQPNGGLIYNPISAADQAVSGAPEPLYVDPVGNCGATAANNTIFRIEPGGYWYLVPGQTTQTWVNAVTTGHKFTVVRW